MTDPIEQPRTTLPDRVLLPFAFDPARLAEDLGAFDEADWVSHAVRQNYDGDWSAIPLRAPAGETHPIRMIYPDPMATHFVDTYFLDRTPYFRAVLARFECPLRTARLMRLTPGSVIKEHVDYNLDAQGEMVRIHIPVTTSPEVAFLLNRRAVAMEPGSVWYLRLTDPHAVANRGTRDRVHLVVDARVNDWLIETLREAAA